MWYTGTKTNCESYNSIVSEEMGLKHGITNSWSKVRKHPSKSLFRIAKHPNFTSDKLTLKTELSDDWNERL